MARKKPTSDAPFNKDYDFLTYFELFQIVKGKENSLNDLFKTIQTAASDDEFREIIWFGIKEHFTKTNNFNIILHVHKQFRKQENDKTISCNNNKSRINYAGEVFDIQSLTCQILSYLDLKSFLCCNRVNKQWLYDSHCPMSIPHLNWNKLHSPNLNVRNVSRFSHIVSLVVDCSIINKRSHVEKLELVQSF